MCFSKCKYYTKVARWYCEVSTKLKMTLQVYRISRENNQI